MVSCQGGERPSAVWMFSCTDCHTVDGLLETVTAVSFTCSLGWLPISNDYWGWGSLFQNLTTSSMSFLGGLFVLRFPLCCWQHWKLQQQCIVPETEYLLLLIIDDITVNLFLPWHCGVTDISLNAILQARATDWLHQFNDMQKSLFSTTAHILQNKKVLVSQVQFHKWVKMFFVT